MDLQPTLVGRLVILRPLVAEDREALTQSASDPEIWSQHPEPTRYRPEVFQRFFQSALDSKGAFAIIDKASGRIIGSTRYLDYSATEKTIEVGYTFLERQYWGCGHNREMKQLLLAHAFRWVEAVHFVIGENNLRSRRAIEKIGATIVDRIQRTKNDGATYQALVYSLRKQDFKHEVCLPMIEQTLRM